MGGRIPACGFVIPSASHAMSNGFGSKTCFARIGLRLLVHLSGRSGRSLVASDPRNLDFSEYAIPDPAEPADSAGPELLTP